MAYRERQKISQMTPKGSDLELTDLLEVSTIENGSYVTKSITGEEIINASSGALDLQAVTDNGNTTTNDIIVDANVNSQTNISNYYISTIDNANNTFASLLNNGQLNLKAGIEDSILKNTNISAGNTVTLEFPDKPTGSYTIATTSDLTSGTVTSVDLTMPSAFSVSGNPITTSGTLAVTGAGLVSQYIDGTGSLQTMPTGLPPTGTAGGDLNGSYPNPTVDGIHGIDMQSGMPTSGDVWVYGGSPAKWQHQMLHASQVDNDSAVTGSHVDDALNTLNTNKVNSSLTISTTAPLSGGGDLTANRTLSISQATTSTDGYLSSTDWNTFNNKISQLTVGTTSIASGTIGRVLFQGTGNVLQQSANLFWDNTNNALGLGASPATTSRLDIRAKDALSTSQSLRVRNSTDTATQFEITGDGRVGIGGNINASFILNVSGTSRFTDNIELIKSNHRLTFTGSTTQGGIIGTNGTFRISGAGSGSSTNYTSIALVNVGDMGGGNITATSGTINIVQVGSNAYGNQVAPTSGNLTYNALIVAPGFNTTGTYSGIGRGIYYNPTLVSTTGLTHRAIETTTGDVIFNSTSGNVAIGGTSFGTSSDKVLAQYTGTAPGSSPADAFQMYSADIVAGNAAPHIRTENGNIIKLYRETTAVASATFVQNSGTGVNDVSTFDGYTIAQVVKALRNLGILA